MSLINTRRYKRSIFLPFAARRRPSNSNSLGSASTTGTPIFSNRAFRISNSLQVGTSFQSTMAICGRCDFPPQSMYDRINASKSLALSG